MATKNKSKFSKPATTDLTEKLKSKKKLREENDRKEEQLNNEEEEEEDIELIAQNKKSKKEKDLDEKENASTKNENKRKREKEDVNPEEKKTKRKKNDIDDTNEKENDEFIVKAKATLKEKNNLKPNEQVADDDGDQEPNDPRLEKLKKKYEFLKEMRVTEIEQQLKNQNDEIVKREKAMINTINVLKTENSRLIELAKDETKVVQLRTENEKLQLEIKSLRESLKTAETKEVSKKGKEKEKAKENENKNETDSNDKANELKEMVNFYKSMTATKVLHLEENIFECTTKNKESNNQVVFAIKMGSNNSVECEPKTVQLNSDRVPEYLKEVCVFEKNSCLYSLLK